MSCGKKSKKKTSFLTYFHFLVNFIRHTGPMVTMVTRCTGSLSQLPVVQMSQGEKSKKKPSVLANFYYLVNFIRHTELWGSTWTFGISYFLCINLYSLSLIFTVILPYLTIINHLSDGLNGFLVKSTIIFCTLPFLWLKRFKSQRFGYFEFCEWLQSLQQCLQIIDKDQYRCIVGHKDNDRT